MTLDIWSKLLCICLAVLVTIAFHGEGVEAICTNPGVLVNNSTILSSTDKTNYTTGEVVLYECDGDVDLAFGTAYVKCKEDGSWTDPDRQCTDAIPLEGGSIAGICVASLNIFIGVFSIIYSSFCRSSKVAAKDDEASEVHVNGGANTTTEKDSVSKFDISEA